MSGVNPIKILGDGDFSVVSFPAVATQAAAVKAAGAAGVRHVCTGASFGFSQPVTAVPLQSDVQILDGASIIWRQTFASVTAQTSVNINVTGLNLVGTAATSMTAQFNAAGGANTQESAVLMGYDVSQ